jgi:cell division protein FtsQ
VAARRSATTRAVLPLRDGLAGVTRFAPSLRSLIVGALIVAAAGGAYVAAVDTSLFAVRSLDIRGGTPAIRARVRAALEGEAGTSLLRIKGGDLASRLAAIPDVLSFRFDRDFPHTLRVVVRREHAALVLRHGADAYLVSATGRVLRPLRHPQLSSLPRYYVPKTVQISIGEPLPAERVPAAAAVAVAAGVRLPGGVAQVQDDDGSLALELGGGVEIRLGAADDLRLKLAIARRILQTTGAAAGGTGYLDVSVPERPVLNANPQVEGRG